MESSHVMALEAKHAGLDQQISAEYRRPNPDTSVINRLKKEKLRLKEQITNH
jgi:hypothetical protein